MRPKLQVALDVLELDRAVKIAKESIEGGVDWIEAGTPLIKSEGMDAVRRLRAEFPDRKIIADMKTTDTGAIEVEMAAKAGASIVAVLGVSDDSTIKDALCAARKYGVELMVDILNVQNPVERSKELNEMGVDYVCVHVGIDQQMVGMDTIELLGDIKKEIDTSISIGGGLDAVSAGRAVAMGADIVIVGGNIIRSAEVKESARKIRDSIDKAEHGEIKKKSREEEIIDLFTHVSTPNISDAMHRKGVMEGIRPVFEGIKMVGRAVTVKTFDGDWAKPVEATDIAKDGDVIVVYAGGREIAPWGELASWSCKRKGISGIVIDGAVRDVDEIRRMRFPVFARYIVPNAGEPKGHGEINAEISCGGQEVKPGDWIIGDDNGLVVVPKERGYEIARRAMEVWKSEERIRKEIKDGSTLSKVLEIEKWEKR